MGRHAQASLISGRLAMTIGRRFLVLPFFCLPPVSPSGAKGEGRVAAGRVWAWCLMLEASSKHESSTSGRSASPLPKIWDTRRQPTDVAKRSKGQGEGLILVVRIRSLVPTVSGGMHDRAVLGPRCRRSHFFVPPHQLNCTAFSIPLSRKRNEPHDRSQPINPALAFAPHPPSVFPLSPRRGEGGRTCGGRSCLDLMAYAKSNQRSQEWQIRSRCVPSPEDLEEGQGEGLILVVRICELVPTVSGGMYDRAVPGPMCREADVELPGGSSRGLSLERPSGCDLAETLDRRC